MPVEFRGSLTETLRNEKERFRSSVRQAMPAVSRAVRDTVRERIPPGVTSTAGMPYAFPGYAATGRMKASFVASPIEERGLDIVARVGLARHANQLDKIKAHVHERGATIVPRRAKYLRFVIGGRVIFAKQVYIRPKRYFESAMDQAVYIVPAVLQARFENFYRSR